MNLKSILYFVSEKVFFSVSVRFQVLRLIKRSVIIFKTNPNYMFAEVKDVKTNFEYLMKMYYYSKLNSHSLSNRLHFWFEATLLLYP